MIQNVVMICKCAYIEPARTETNPTTGQADPDMVGVCMGSRVGRGVPAYVWMLVAKTVPPHPTPGGSPQRKPKGVPKTELTP